MENFYLPIIIKLHFIKSAEIRMALGLVCSLFLGTVCMTFAMLGLDFCLIFMPSINVNILISAKKYVDYYRSTIGSFQNLHFYILGVSFYFLEFSLFILGYVYCYKLVKSRFNITNPRVSYFVGLIINTLIFILWEYLPALFPKIESF